MMLTMMAPLPAELRQETARRIGNAFRRASGIEGVELKVAEDFLQYDHGQLQRHLSGIERTQVFERVAAVAAQQEGFFGRFVACLLDEFGGWREVLSHGLGQFVAALVTGAGQARMARATLDPPRSREESTCGGGSWRVSA